MIDDFHTTVREKYKYNNETLINEKYYEYSI